MTRLSNKQIGMAAACPRKWAAHYLFKFPESTSEALIYGNRVHAQAAAVLTGAPPPFPPESPEAKLFRAMLDHLPLPSADDWTHVEIVEDVEVRPGLVVQLRADYLSRPWLVDWKTTGAPSRKATLPSPVSPTGKKYWALQSLADDYQARIYARLLLVKWAEEPAIPARWVFGSKKFSAGQEPRTWPLDEVFVRADTCAWWDRYVEPAVRVIEDLRAAFDAGCIDSPLDVPHDEQACERQGTFCDYAGHCRFIPAPDTAPTLIQLRLPHPERTNRAL